jgi:hypothetical protein
MGSGSLKERKIRKRRSGVREEYMYMNGSRKRLMRKRKI